MTDFIFTVAKGSAIEKVADDPTKRGILLLQTVESDGALRDRTTVAQILAHNSECDFTNYSRITGIVGTVSTVASKNRRVISIPTPQTWSDAGGAVNNTVRKVVIFYEDSASDAGRIPLVCYGFRITTNGTDLVATVPSGILRAE
jgi:hypothetical protein